MATYRHPMGYHFDHPDGWQVQATEQGIFLVPGDAARDPMGNPLEVLSVGSQTAPGIARPDDPQVVAFFDQNSPGLRRTAGPEPVDGGFGPGTRMTYEGAINGVDAVRHLYVTLHGGEVIYLSHEARRDLSDGRDADARAVFASLGHEQPQGDPDLAGVWRRSSTSGSYDSFGGVGATDQETLVMYPDGRVEYGVSTTVYGSVPGASAFSPGDPNVRRGRYVGAGGRLQMTWDAGGSDVFQYSVFLHDGWPHLKLLLADGAKRFFRRAN